MTRPIMVEVLVLGDERVTLEVVDDVDEFDVGGVDNDDDDDDTDVDDTDVDVDDDADVDDISEEEVEETGASIWKPFDQPSNVVLEGLRSKLFLLFSQAI